MTLSGCVTRRTVYYNDSDKIYTDFKGKGVCEKVEFDCVVMSQGKYRTLTTVPEDK